MQVKKQDAKGKMKEKFDALRRRLSRTGLVAQGTITEREIRAAGRRTAREKSYGPYFQWTFKRQGKTVTVNLSAAQRKIFQAAIDNNRKLEDIVSEMRRLSLAMLELSTKGVRKRKRKSEN
jgi:hypothetical protein